ncbi:NAD(P)/FAD-dependent oxidoreductase [Dysgonomonas sp. Marseille-P4677]|uniref:NAD(P)/FAD-dependent oxidoreductase n=1 Tax=Dysgonomonas sp. Marseille-P4677 TaxID=2364790 RepID=UPI001911BD3D|nr:NAD(P)/FAD-dependent oxidoreductase [Dysgonomonas sp. Marseille-P4677]MBK5720702.1 NAD(P)/FAD-dependent oxidoreductase [Dysgonomonas sp. Marseille-P4677]
MDLNKQIIIIGAGPAGLTAAYELTKNCITDSISVYEATSNIGGISQTVRYNGNRIDIGGHRFFSKNDEIMAWWNNIMPIQGSQSIDDILLNNNIKELNNGGPDPEKEEIVMLLRKRVSRIFYLKKFFNYPISIQSETFVNMGLGRTINAGFGYLGSCIRKREENSLEDFYINRFGKPLYRMFFENYTEKVWGVHPSKLGADWGSQRVKGLSLLGIIRDMISKPFRQKKSSIDQKEVETSLIEQFLYPKYGPGQLWETVADIVENKGVKVIKDSPVKQINIKDKKVVSVVVNTEGKDEEVSCDYLISSMPIKDLIESINDNISTEVREIAKELPYRDFITVGLLVDKLLISNKTKTKTWNNIIPDTWIYIQEADVKIGRLQIFNNWSPYMVADFKNKVWIGLEYFCNEGDELWEMNDKNFIDLAISELDKIGIISMNEVEDSVRIKVKKAYPSYFGSYHQLDKVIDYLSSIENLYCIGRNGQHRYNNMDHSMLTAIETVKHIKGEINDKSIIWRVNTENDYHEKK